MKSPLISIITINKNECESLRRTIESVSAQSFEDYEFILVDAASSDGSQELIEERRSVIDKISIGPDSGISEGFNRGIQLASGKWMHFLNSGDVFISNEALKEMATQLEGNFVVSALVAYRGHPYPSRSVFSSRSLKKRSMIHHQGSFIPRIHFQRYGVYDQSFKVRMDYEFWLRVLKHEEVKFVDQIIVNFEAGKSFRDIRSYYFEEMRAHRKHFKSWPLINFYSLLRFVARWTLRNLGFNV